MILTDGLFPGQQPPADLGEFQVRLAGDDVIGQSHDRLAVAFVTDFRAAKNDDQFGPQAV